MDDLKNFIDLYKEVIDRDGDMKLCGREKCRELILAGQKINPNICFGNMKTGVVEQEVMVNFYKEIMQTG